MRGDVRRNGAAAELSVGENHRLVTDGGETEGEESAEEEAESEQAEESEAEATGEEEAEDEEERTTVLYLDLEGLFLNLLGLEIDLNEVELDISAMSRPGGLLGNLLSGVAGLLDKGPLSRLSDAVSGFELPSMPEFELPSVSDVLPGNGENGGLSNVIYGMINELLDMLLEALGEDESADEEASNS
ncbi:hypothetical protein [Haladaptatus cibarius]|uniref:hypothetical protein n=1 Tax=Haladaptatus cibarius TaxID=453847 RepID=UPI000678465B|nr:hypothetical protein [Haladaptatus cibarius]